MNSSEIYLKISKNILDCISSFDKNEINKLDFNNNLFLNISFLTKFAAGKNIQENPNFNNFIPKKSNLFNTEIAKNINKETRKNSENEMEYSIINAENEINNNNNNYDLDQANLEDITGKIENNFDLETHNSISIFNENADETLNKTTNNIMRDMKEFEKKDKNTKENMTLNLFDFDQSYVDDISTIYQNDNCSEFRLDQSILDPNLSVIMRKGTSVKNKNAFNKISNDEGNKNRNK